MPKVRYLTIQFDQALTPREVPYFRAAVIEKTRRESDLFHNHREDGASVYRYPCIQYRPIQGKAAVVCLNAGADDIHHLLQHRDLSLQIGNQRRQFAIEDVHMAYHNVQAWAHPLSYFLQHWQALNQANFQQYMALPDEPSRLALLERLLCANLLAFASGIGWHAEERLHAHITRLHRTDWLPFKGQKTLCFSLDFQTNVSLPDYVGLGKGVSVGFGGVRGMGGGR